MPKNSTALTRFDLLDPNGTTLRSIRDWNADSTEFSRRVLISACRNLNQADYQRHFTPTWSTEQSLLTALWSPVVQSLSSPQICVLTKAIYRAQDDPPLDSYFLPQYIFAVREQSNAYRLATLIPDATTLCAISRLMKMLDSFPNSYNQIFLQGSLAYCGRALRQGAALHGNLLRDITQYVALVEPTVTSFAGDVPPGWSKLDFALYADRFANIERALADSNVLPSLDDLPLEDLVTG